MSLIDFILNLAGLLLWLRWRSAGHPPAPRPVGGFLVSPLKSGGRAAGRGWAIPLALLLLLVGRALVYRTLGGAAEWTPALSIAGVPFFFRSDFLGRILLFSFLSFALTLGIFYTSLILLSVVNRRLADTDPQQRFVRLHLGWAERFPALLRLLLPVLATALLWVAFHPVLVAADLLPWTRSWLRLAEQGLVIGLSAWLAWSYLLIIFLLLHLVTSYVYLGNSTFLHYVNQTSRTLLPGIGWLPLRFGRVDFAPLVMVAVVLLVARWGERGLALLYHRLAL